MARKEKRGWRVGKSVGDTEKGGWELGIPVAELKSIKFPFHVFYREFDFIFRIFQS